MSSSECRFTMSNSVNDTIEFIHQPGIDMWTVGNAVMDSLCAMYTLTSLLEEGYTYGGEAA